MEINPITPKDLDKINVHDDEGRQIACLAMGVTLFIENAFTKQMRRLTAECIDQYIDLTRNDLRWFLLKGGQFKKISDRVRDIRKIDLPPLTQVVETMEEDETFLVTLSGAEDYEQASSYSLTALMEFKKNFYDIGFLTAWLPFTMIENQPPKFFKKMVVQWCQQLRPLHGYAGIYIVLSAERYNAMNSEPMVYPIVKRFPGIEFDSPTVTSIHFKKGIKGVNWLTVLSNKFVNQLGGLKTLEQGLDEACPLYPYPGGVVIQAGPYPQIGDLEKGIQLTDYQKVYRLVKPVQAEYPYGYLRTPKDVDSKAFAQQWLHRFE